MCRANKNKAKRPKVNAFTLRFVRTYGQTAQARDLDSVELFAGEAAITVSAQQLGMHSVAYDKSYSESSINDLCSRKGFRRALQLVMRIKQHGSLWGAPVCSSWVWISRGEGGRSTTCPAGNHTTDPRIAHANRMVTLLVFLYLVAWRRGVHIFMENPLSTIMHMFSPMMEFIDSCLKHKVTCYMGAYGGDTVKPLSIWSTTSKVARLWTKKPKMKKAKKLSTTRAHGVDGNKKELKASQAYPLAFGKAVAAIFQALLQEQRKRDLFEAMDSESDRHMYIWRERERERERETNTRPTWMVSCSRCSRSSTRTSTRGEPAPKSVGVAAPGSDAALVPAQVASTMIRPRGEHKHHTSHSINDNNSNMHFFSVLPTTHFFLCYQQRTFFCATNNALFSVLPTTHLFWCHNHQQQQQ